MSKLSTIILALSLLVFFSLPVSVLAATDPGIKPGSFFYFFDTTFEQVGLFFTFDPEEKAKKALEYAEERLAEAEAVTDNAEAVKTAVANYESNIAFAAEKSKGVGEKEKAEALLTTISDSTSRHQEVLAVVLTKVPDEAKEAITKAIEASRKGHEEALQKIAELKGEIEQLKQEVSELKAKDEERKKVIEELNKQKPESTPSSTKLSLTTSQAPKATIVTLPNGAVVETDINGNIIRYIKEIQTVISRVELLEIVSVSVNVAQEQTSAKIEWQTNKPTEAKVFISGGNLPSQKVFISESGFSTRHIASIVGLARGFKFSYEIEAIAKDAVVVKKLGNFETEAPRAATMKVYAWRDDRTLDNNRNSSLYVYGCDTQYIEVAILDQYGDKMFGPEVTFITPKGTSTKIISQIDKLSDNSYGTRFWYTPRVPDTTEKLTFKSGLFKQEAVLTIGPKHPQLDCSEPYLR